MLKAQYRIPKKEIPRIARMGKRYTSELFDIKVWFDNNLEHSLFAFVVSTKIDKRAVVRNTIKRKFRAAMYEILKDNELNKDSKFREGSYIFLIKNVKVKELKSEEIKLMIKKILGN